MNQNTAILKNFNFVCGVFIVILLDFFGFILMGRLISNGLYPLASVLGALLVFLSIVYLRPRFSAYRWLAVSIVFVLMFTVYPIAYTFLVSMSNMSSGHILSRKQAIERLENKQYLPDDALSYSWTAYQSDSSQYLLVLNDESGNRLIVYPDREPESLSQINDSEDIISIPNYKRINQRQSVSLIDKLATIPFKGIYGFIYIQSLSIASEMQNLYKFSSKHNAMRRTSDDTLFYPQKGTFTSDSGEELSPGFYVNIGIENYQRFFGNTEYFQPMGRILVWNLAFSFFSVTISFCLGFLIALVFDDLPGRRIIRTLLIIPYPIPVLVAITVWRGLLNERMGLVTGLLNIFGEAPNFFTDRNWARLAIILINVYLSYPYFYILASGALRSIPTEIFQAAAIDGAGPLKTVRFITVPMVLRILAPLLIASFSFNFNNFTLIWVYNAGLPAMADTVVPMGHTDLLISFVYRLGFATANVANYGFAAAITVILFFFVAIMVFSQARSMKSFKENN